MTLNVNFARCRPVTLRVRSRKQTKLHTYLVLVPRRGTLYKHYNVHFAHFRLVTRRVRSSKQTKLHTYLVQVTRRETLYKH